MAVFGFHLRDRPVAGIDLPRLARLTDGYSGADIALRTAPRHRRCARRACGVELLEPADAVATRFCGGEYRQLGGLVVARRFVVFAGEVGEVGVHHYQTDPFDQAAAGATGRTYVSRSASRAR